MRVTGSCHCGRITIRAEVDPERARICHCTDCQKLSGSAFRVVLPEADFEILTGEPRIYVKTAESGNARQQAFCSDCGTPIYATSVGGAPRTIGIRAGILNQRDRLVPRRQYWVRSALGWLPELPGLRAFDQD
jgi:hypothetical protein